LIHKLRLIMLGNSLIGRRQFLQWGALGGMLVAAGCSGGDGAPQEVATPPVEGGNRMILKKNAEAGEAKGKKK
jgi:hypothetical protein